MANVSKLRLNGISYDIKDNDAREQLALIQNQFNQLIAPSGEAPNPAQIQNARIGVDGVVYDTLGNAIRTQINNLNNIIINNGGGLSTDAKMALLNCFQKVAWIDDQGQIYYNALHDSLFPTAISISARFNSASHVFYDTDTLNDLRPYLTVRATLPDNTTEIITNYSLRGSMTVGTNIITVQYQGLTDTFSVTVAADPAYITATYTQTNPVIEYDSLDYLKSDLVVKHYTLEGNFTILDAADYTLSGTLEVGNSTITVTYGSLTTTFVATVSSPTLFTPTYFGNSNISRGNSTEAQRYFSDKDSSGDSVCATTSGDHSAVLKGSSSSSPTYTIYPFKIPSNAKRVFVYSPAYNVVDNHSSRINLSYWSSSVTGGWICITPDTWARPYNYINLSDYSSYTNLYVTFSLGSHTTNSSDLPLFKFGWV